MLPIRTSISAVLRHYPFHAGYEAIGLSKLLALFARREQYALAYLRDGSKILVYGKDHVGRILLYMGDFEPKISYLAKRLIRPGDTVLDIGSNLGWFSILASPLVGDAGHVHAFEPQPMLNTLFRASLVMNGMSNVTLHEVALSDADGAVDLHVLKGNLGAGRLSAETGDTWSTITVQAKEAETYLDTLHVQAVKLVKIDVEGHEAIVFERGRKFFERVKPEAIIFESSSDQAFADRPVVKLIHSMGYRIFSLGDGWMAPRLIEREAGCPEVPTIDHLALLDGPGLSRNLEALR